MLGRELYKLCIQLITNFCSTLTNMTCLGNSGTFNTLFPAPASSCCPIQYVVLLWPGYPWRMSLELGECILVLQETHFEMDPLHPSSPLPQIECFARATKSVPMYESEQSKSNVSTYVHLIESCHSIELLYTPAILLVHRGFSEKF